MKSIRHLLKRSIGSSRSYTRLFALLALIAVVGSVSVSASPIETVTQAIKDAWSSAVGAIAGTTSEQATQEPSAPQELTVCPGGCQFGTLEDAVAAARPGDTVKVLAGTYYLTGNIVINKPINLVGPNDSISPVRGSRSEEAVIALPQKGSIVVASNNVVISGFKFTSQGGSATRGAIIGGTEVSSASGQVVVSRNVFENLNISKGAAILVSDSSTRNGSGNWSIRDNGFTDIVGADSVAVRVANTRSAATVVGNSFANVGGAAVQVVNTVGSVIDGNSIAGVGQEGIRVGAGSTDTTVRGNSVDRAQTAGDYTKGAIMIESGLGVGTLVENNLLTNSLTAMAVAGASQELVIRFNHLASSNANGFYATGTDASAVINAENNYWGAEFGPANFGSQGSKLSSEGPQIDVEPYISNFENRSFRRARAGFWPRANATTASKGEAGAALSPSTPSFVACGSGENVCNVTQNTAHSTIQAAIDAANPGDRIDTAAVTFTENVVIDIPVDLRGAQYGQNAFTRTTAESIVRPAVAGSTTPSSANPSAIFKIDAAVTSMTGLYINGFTLDGNNTGSVTRGITRNGTDIDVDAAFASSTADGVVFTGTYNGTSGTIGLGFFNNRVANVGLEPTTGAAVQLEYTATNVVSGQNSDIAGNRFTNVGGAVYLERNFASVYANRIIDAGIAINIGSHQIAPTFFYQADGNVITGSSVEHLAEPIGISLSVQGSSAKHASSGYGYFLRNNSVTFTGAAATKATGIRILNVLSNPAIYSNSITGGQFGFLLTGNDGAVVNIYDDMLPGMTMPSTATTVTGAMTGVRATTDTIGGGTYFLNSGIDIINASVVGIESFDQGLGTVSVSATGVTLSGTSSVKGVVATGGTASATITNSTIIEQTGVQYENITTGTQIATCNWWGAATGPAAGKIVQNTGTVTTTPFKKKITATECAAPSVSAVTANDVTYGTNVTVSATVTDASTISTVEYRVGTTGGWTAMSNGGSGSSYSATITKPSVGSYTVYVRAKDINDNESDGSASDPFAVSAKALTITGLTGANKPYDGNTTASATGTADLAVGGVEAGDTVNLGGTPVFTFDNKNVGTGKTITTTGYTISGASASNYTLTQPTLSADITALALTVTGLTGNNKVYDGTTTATASGTAALSGVISGDTVTLGVTPVYSFSSKTVETGKTITTTGYTISGADSANYSLTQPSLTADITAKALSVTGLTGANKPYDGNTSATASGVASLSGVETGDIVTLGGLPTFTFASKTVGAGKTISTTGYTISGADSGNYTLNQPSLTADITAATLTITGLTGSNKVYDGNTTASATGTAALSGVVSGDTVTLGGTAAFSFADKNVGTGKAITASGYTIGGADAGNYSLTQPTGLTGDITPKALTITGLTGNNKTYDASTSATASGTAVLSGIISGDTVTLGGTPSYSFASKTIGTAKAITTTGFTIGGADSANYSLTQPSLTANITAKGLTITGLTGANKQYDGNTTASATGTAALSGVEAGDTVTLGGTPVYTFSSKTIGTGKTITTTGYTISGTDSGNYTLTQPSLTGDITVKTLTVIGLTGANKTYDGNTTATATGTAALSGVATGDTVTLTGTPAFSFADKNIGTAKAITTTGYTLGGADVGNYTLTQPSLSANITAKTLTITGITGNNKEYDGTTAATVSGTAILSGIVAGDTVTLGGSGTYVFANKNAGTGKAITTTGFTIGGADSGNYTLTQPSLTANITKATLNINAVAGSKTYGSIDPDFSAAYYTLSGYRTGDNAGNVTVTGLGFCTRVTGESVGTYTLTCYAGTLSSTNYSFTSGTTALFTINAKTLTISGLTGNNKPYDGNTTASAAGTASLVGVISGDVVTLGGTPSFSFADKNVGTGKTITTTGYTISGAAAGNYTLTQPTLSGNITAKALTITGLTGNNKTYDATTTATVAGTASLSGVVAGDTVNLDSTAATFSFANKNIGTGKSITASGYTINGTDAGNYTLTQPTGLTGDITAKALTITGLTGANKTYDGNTTASVTGTAALSGVVAGDTVTLGGTAAFSFADKNVGAAKAITASGYTISGTDSGNYTVTQPTGLTGDITAKALTVTGITADSRQFDGTTNITTTGTATLSGVISPDVVTLGGGGGFAFATASVGTGKTVTFTAYSISGADAGNYTLTQPTFTADIFGKTLTATISVNSKVYDGNTNATISACTLVGVVPSSPAVSCNFAGKTAQFDNKNVGTGKATSVVSGLTLSGADAGNYSFDGSASGTDGIITKKPLSLDAVANSKTYGDSDPSFTYTLSGFVTGENTTNVTITGTAGACTRASGETVAGSPYEISCSSMGTLSAANYTFVTGATANFTINAKALTVIGLTGTNKVYDGNTTATASGTAGLSGVLPADLADVTLSGTATYTFASKNVGTGISISTTGFTLTGTKAGNYTVTQPTLSANITAKNLTISGATASNRAYNAGTGATVNFASASLTGVVVPDVVTINSSAYTASFATASVGTAKPVTVAGVTLSGADSGNYTVSQPTGLTADITKATANVNAIAVSKVWGNTDPVVTYSLSGLFSPDTPSTIGLTGDAVCNRVVGEDVGTYVITCTPGTLASTNYNFVTGTTALLTITPLPYGTVYNTPVGTNINPMWGNTTSPASQVSVNFASVTTAGNTTVTQLSPSSPGYVTPPTGVSTGVNPLYFDISSTAVYTAPVTVCFTYPAANYYGSTPKLYHYKAGAWSDVTTTTDTINNVVCGSVTSFSPFMLGATLTPTAAGVSLGGRVLDPAGRAVANANIRVIDLETGSTGMAKTNQFGRYSIGGLTAGKGYVVTASSKNFPGGISREVNLVDSLADFDLSFGSTTASASATEGVSTAPAPTTVVMPSVRSNDVSVDSGRGREASPVSQPRPTVVIDSTAPKAKSKKKKKDNQQ